ncbi:hypothetical protein ES319_D12G203500v1 [Gossypium barbadense]|uniref:Remorin C-terminal domain-containing protein n=1 Tax=Gossypium barbadense TaxID=3634 RepID=A0A5J5P0V5_GOSBA|nr:hypothetical protein ES319_D12G203500v1 [Gossypium barbadense]
MNDDYNTELAVGVAAAAYIINSLVEDEARHRIKIRRSAQDTISGVRSSDRVTMRYSSKEIETAGETSSRKLMEKDNRSQESSLPRSKKGGSSSGRPIAWEKAEMEKLNKRCENMKASILAWENEKKLRAKVKMDKRKKELERRIKINQQLYQTKISRIDHIGGGAKAEVDEKRRHEELKIKEKARKIRASGKVPVSCFCF